MKLPSILALLATGLLLTGCVGNTGGTNQSEHMVNDQGTPAADAPANTTANDQVGTMRDTTNDVRVSRDTTGQGTTQQTGRGNSVGGEPVGSPTPGRTDGTASGNNTTNDKASSRTRNGVSTNNGQ